MVNKEWIDQAEIKSRLSTFFDTNGHDIAKFGLTVNQTFEAFVYAATISWYKENGWQVEIKHPKYHKSGDALKLKFSTRGRPSNYSYAQCVKGKQTVHIRHGLRVATSSYDSSQNKPANICLDVAVIKPIDLDEYSTDCFVPNSKLVTFGEAKHMSAFAELLANFIGLVHELQPERLKQTKRSNKRLQPFLYVSGFLQNTALGIKETVEARGYDIGIYWRTSELSSKCSIPERDPIP